MNEEALRPALHRSAGIDSTVGRQSLWPSLVAASTGLIACGVLAFLLTQGFQAWTYEGARQLRAARGELLVPRTPLHLHDADSIWPNPAAGTVYLVDFIYTRCPGVCQASGSVQQQMQSALVERELAGRVQLLSISFDPADSREDLARHAALHRADAARWRLAKVPTPAERAALLRAVGLVVLRDGQGGFVHNAAIHLVDRRGVVRGVYDIGDWQIATADALKLASSP